MGIGELKVVVSTETSEAEAALDRVEEKLQAVTTAAREAREAISALSGVSLFSGGRVFGGGGGGAGGGGVSGG